MGDSNENLADKLSEEEQELRAAFVAGAEGIKKYFVGIKEDLRGLKKSIRARGEALSQMHASLDYAVFQHVCQLDLPASPHYDGLQCLFASIVTNRKLFIEHTIWLCYETTNI